MAITVINWMSLKLICACKKYVYEFERFILSFGGLNSGKVTIKQLNKEDIQT